MKLKNTFLKGVVNTDLNHRLIPQDTYISSQNLRFRSNGNDGVGEYIKGTLKLTEAIANQNYICIGGCIDKENDRFYYFNAGDTRSEIVEYDTKTNTAVVVLSWSDCIPLLNKDKKIIGCNYIDGYLFWVEQHLHEPRYIKIERAKTWLHNGFTKDDVSVIKKPPTDAWIWKIDGFVLLTDTNTLMIITVVCLFIRIGLFFQKNLN
jgi:hypothetical protein